jgi:hypothetical protein
MQAKVEKDYISVKASMVLEGQLVVEVDCEDYDYYRSLPAAITFDGKLLGKTGWNSDRNYACYKQGVMLAKVVR